MRMTTLARIKNLLDPDMITTKYDPMLTQIIASVSAQIENSPFFNRYVEKKERTEYFDTEKDQSVVSLKGMPIDTSATLNVYHDTSRTFGASTLIDPSDYYVDAERGLIKFDNYSLSEGKGSLKIQYTGGMAAHLNRLIAVYTTATGTPVAGQVVTGNTSGAKGVYISSYSSGINSVTIDVTYGVFEIGETVTLTTSAATFVLSSFTQNPLMMAYPDLVHACELQAIFVYKRRNEIGLRSVSGDGGSIATYSSLDLLAEVKKMLSAMRRYA